MCQMSYSMNVCVALINSLKCFNAPAGIIKCSGGIGSDKQQQIYRQTPLLLPLPSTRQRHLTFLSHDLPTYPPPPRCPCCCSHSIVIDKYQTNPIGVENCQHARLEFHLYRFHHALSHQGGGGRGGSALRSDHG